MVVMKKSAGEPSTVKAEIKKRYSGKAFPEILETKVDHLTIFEGHLGKYKTLIKRIFIRFCILKSRTSANRALWLPSHF